MTNKTLLNDKWTEFYALLSDPNFRGSPSQRLSIQLVDEQGKTPLTAAFCASCRLFIQLIDEQGKTPIEARLLVTRTLQAEVAEAVSDEDVRSAASALLDWVRYSN